MWSSLQRVQICLILVAFYGSDFCAALGVGPRTISFRNSTTSSTRSSSSTQSTVNGPLITPTSTLLSSSSTVNYTSTITSAPVYPWGNQSIPVNTCSVTATDGSIQWTPCNIFAGTVQMSYFPESKGNLSYSSTFYNTEWSVTMTSPSVYMMVNTISGYNSCGPLGPTYVDKVISMDLTDVYTLQPYADHTVTTRMGPPQILTLSDLTSNCLNTYGTFSTDGAFVNTHPVFGNYNRCRPRFVFPIELKRVGYPYWMHCGNDDYEWGIFDPPGAVPPVVGLLPTTIAAPITPTYESASALPTPVSDQAASTTTPDVQTTPTPPVDPSIPGTTPLLTDIKTPPPPSTLLAQSLIVLPDHSSILPIHTSTPADSPPPANPSTPSDPSNPGTSQPATRPTNPVLLQPLADPAPPASTPVDPTTPVYPVTPGTTPLGVSMPPALDIIPADPATSVDPSGPGTNPTPTDSFNPSYMQTWQSPASTLRLADSLTPADPTSTPSAADPLNPADPADPGTNPSSANPSASPELPTSGTSTSPADSSTSENPTTDTNPPASDQPNPPVVTPSILIPTSATAIAIVGSQTISAIPGSSGVVLPNGSTATPGSVATVTDSNSQPIVVSVGTSGIYVGGTSSGDATSFYANPTVPAVAIATVASQVISAAPGATNVVVGSQTASLGGSPITVSGSIIQLTPSGIVVNDDSGGAASTYAIPTLAGSHDVVAPTPIATIAGQIISAAPGATNVVVGGQTASLGGAPITVSGSVIQLTPSGVVVNDDSGGAASTYAIPTLAGSHDVVAPTPIATIGGQVISAAPGDSTVVINGQILTAGGALVTLAGSNNVASLGPSGLVIQYPGGSVSSYALPTAAPSIGGIVATVAGISISASAGASIISIGGQEVTLGGAPITVSNEVFSLGPSGLEIQMPGGRVTTISAPIAASTAAGVVTSMSSGKGIASIIASIAGASQTGISTGIESTGSASGTTLSSPTAVTKSGVGANRIIWSLLGQCVLFAVLVVR